MPGHPQTEDIVTKKGKKVRLFLIIFVLCFSLILFTCVAGAYMKTEEILVRFWQARTSKVIGGQ